MGTFPISMLYCIILVLWRVVEVGMDDEENVVPSLGYRLVLSKCSDEGYSRVAETSALEKCEILDSGYIYLIEHNEYLPAEDFALSVSSTKVI